METIKLYFLLFITYSILGWIMEIIVTLPDNKCFVNRGFLIGPYCPIYGSCSILMISLLDKIKSPILLFILSVVICSVGEYITSYGMEKLFHARWWDYSNRKFNLNGRICLSNCIAFGILGLILVKYVNKLFVNLYLSFNPLVISILFYTLLTLFIVDTIISFKIIFKIKSMSLKFVNLDNTKEITEKVKNILNDKLLLKRLFKAFPNVKIILKNKIVSLKDKTIKIKNNIF